MTEKSVFWDTNGTGDGTGSGYTESDLFSVFRSLFTANGTHLGGVAADFANKLAVSGATSPAVVATGAALVYGIPYVNDASVNVVIATPTTATRIDRIVLRASWAAQTVRITRIAGSEGGAAPALTQTGGTTWDVPLAQVAITTGGAMTIADERVWLSVVGDLAVTTAKLGADAVTGAKLADDSVDSEHYVDGSIDTAHIGLLQITTGLLAADAVTGAKLADDSVDSEHLVDGSIDTAHLSNDSVDDTKAGARVPQFYRRQGGGATDWSDTGSNNYTPTSVRMQAGSIDVSISPAATTAYTTVTFPVAFSSKPIVLLTNRAWDDVFATVDMITSTTFVVRWRSANNKGNAYANWLAIGPE